MAEHSITRGAAGDLQIILWALDDRHRNAAKYHLDKRGKFLAQAEHSTKRGRAFHVDRSIDLNYWFQMDWPNFKDITNKRTTPRLRSDYCKLMAGETLAKRHKSELLWHCTNTDEPPEMPKSEGLYKQALRVELTETERVAQTLALYMEN